MRLGWRISKCSSVRFCWLDYISNSVDHAWKAGPQGFVHVAPTGQKLLVSGGLTRIDVKWLKFNTHEFGWSITLMSLAPISEAMSRGALLNRFIQLKPAWTCLPQAKDPQ